MTDRTDLECRREIIRKARETVARKQPENFDDADRRAEALLWRQRQAREQKLQRETVRLGNSSLSWVLVDDREVKDAKAMRDLGALDKQQRRQLFKEPLMSEVTDLSPAAMQRWNDWLDARLEKNSNALLDVIADEVGKLIREKDDEIKALRDELAALRADFNVVRGIQSGEIAKLTKANTNAA